MPLFLASIVLGIVPMIIYALIVWRIDRWEKEPLPLLIAAFLWGSIPAVIFAIIAQVILEIPVLETTGETSLFGELYQASFIAPVSEEITKGFGLILIFLIFRREIDSILDGLIYGSMIGFGFSAVENILYFSGQTEPAGLILLFFLRAFIFGMLHALFTGLFGVGLALGKFTSLPLMRFLWPALGLGFAMLTHAIHNYFATIGGEHIAYAIVGVTLGVAWFIATVVTCLWHENRWIRLHLADEVDEQVLFAEQALDTARFWSRSSLTVLTQGSTAWKRRHLLHEATELAFEKQRQYRFGITHACEIRLEQLRIRVRELSRKDPLFIAGLIKPEKRLPPPLPPIRKLPPPLP
ncbi:MAG: PrsW family intramembrane metalloprotease [Verrucomicrobiales bacterium]|nr:PrsW family intramembrane metalloprotease [Verrucomicrobiales bacterium]